MFKGSSSTNTSLALFLLLIGVIIYNIFDWISSNKIILSVVFAIVAVISCGIYSVYLS
jgi:drug/metabolite transporter (DMT)-like permease